MADSERNEMRMSEVMAVMAVQGEEIVVFGLKLPSKAN